MMNRQNFIGSNPPSLWSFALSAPDRQIFTNGLMRHLPSGPAHTLAERVRHFFADASASSRETDDKAPLLLVGALPFDRMADDFLFQPATLSDRPWRNDAGTAPLSGHVSARPDRLAYQNAVTRALTAIAASQISATPLHKIVLSRSLLLRCDEAIDPVALFHRLAGDPGAVRFLTPIGADEEGRPRHLVGATPELLLSKKGAAIVSHPLAGSARRSADTAKDAGAAASLTQSAKDQREHQWVIEAILDALSPYCSTLNAPRAPSLVSTQTMWHLGTRIEGQLKHPDAVSAAELAALLHPTPAVGGFPRERALPLIPALEGYDRSFYAGTVGWTDASGDGAWYVSLRCAQISGRQAQICAGAGIVEGSDPLEEANETSAKLLAILRALGIDENGRSLMAMSDKAADTAPLAAQPAP